jgi:hypothetical protein
MKAAGRSIIAIDVDDDTHMQDSSITGPHRQAVFTKATNSIFMKEAETKIKAQVVGDFGFQRAKSFRQRITTPPVSDLPTPNDNNVDALMGIFAQVGLKSAERLPIRTQMVFTAMVLFIIAASKRLRSTLESLGSGRSLTIDSLICFSRT